MSFFDTTPAGRILNRCSKDIDVLESTIPSTLKLFLFNASSLVQVILVISIATPLFLVLLVPIVILYIFLQRFYIPTSRQLKRLEATARSPVIANFGEILQGFIFYIQLVYSIRNNLLIWFAGRTTIVAFGAQKLFISESAARSDENNLYSFGTVATTRWISFYMELMGTLIVVSAAVVSVASKALGVSPSVVGLSVAYALQASYLPVFKDINICTLYLLFISIYCSYNFHCIYC